MLAGASMIGSLIIRASRFGAAWHADPFVNRPEGKGYALAFAPLMQDDGINTKDESAMSAFSAVPWLNEEPERMIILREMHDSMSPGERSRLNSPISARQRVEKVLRARSGGTEETMRNSPVAKYKVTIAEQARKIAHLEEQLAAAERRDGSRFDLNHDTIPDIAKAIVANVAPARAKHIAAAIKTALKEIETPAG